MNTLVKYVVAAGAAAAAMGATLASAAPVNFYAAKALGQQISSTAAFAERGAASGGVAIAVRGAVQNVIIGSAQEPMVVLTALDNVLAACRQGARHDSEWTCPSSPEAFAAVAGLRGVVIAQLEQTDPAALDTPGTAAFGSVPSTSAGSSNYRSF